MDVHDHCLGPYGSPESHESYKWPIAEWRIVDCGNSKIPDHPSMANSLDISVLRGKFPGVFISCTID
jgi:hypothetical protein